MVRNKRDKDAARAPVRLDFDARKLAALLRTAQGIAARGKGLRLVLEGAEPEERDLLVRRLAKSTGLKVRRIDLSEVLAEGIEEAHRVLKVAFAPARPAEFILFFDEADALFGRRGAVKDSHDRYANLETSYLLALERFPGWALISVMTPAEAYAGLGKAADLLVDFRPGARAAPVPWDQPLPNRHFLVFIGDLEIGVCRVTGMADADETAAADEAGRPRTLVLRRALSRSKDLYHWRRAAAAGKQAARTLELRQLPAPGARPVNRWRFLGCRPLAWRGPDFDALEGGLAFEEIEIQYDSLEWL